MTALRGALGFLEGGVFAELPPKGRELIAIARNNTDRLTRIINNILDLERLKSGRMTFAPSEFDVAELVARVKEVHGLEDEAWERAERERLEHLTQLHG